MILSALPSIDFIIWLLLPFHLSGLEKERKVSMRLHRGAPVNISSSDLTGRQDTSRMSTSQVTHTHTQTNKLFIWSVIERVCCALYYIKLIFDSSFFQWCFFFKTSLRVCQVWNWVHGCLILASWSWESKLMTKGGCSTFHLQLGQHSCHNHQLS